MKPDVFYLSVLLTATYAYTSAVHVKPQSKDSEEDLRRTNKNHTALPGVGTPENMTYIINGYKQEQEVAVIIDALEKLGILSTKKYSCYSLKKITRYSMSGKKEEVVVGVTMEFKEVYEPRGQSRTSTADSRATSTRRPRIKGKKKCIPKSHSKPSLNAEKDRGHSQSVDCLISSEKDMAVDIGVHTDNSTLANKTLTEVGTPQGSHNVSIVKDRSSRVETNHGGGLSRTQLMVIITCSVVIGVFFIVAFILRIRNYIKRLREEQALARRPTFRSCSMALRGSSNHSEDSQCKDANVNKDQEKAGNVYLQMEDKDSQDGLDSIPVSPRIANQEHRPLLQVTSLSAPASPAVTRNTFDNLGKSESPGVNPTQDNLSESSVNGESEEEQVTETNPLQAQSQERLLDFGAKKSAPEERLLDFGGKNMPPDRKVKCEKLQGKECGGTSDIAVPPSGQELALNTQANTGLTQSDSSITSSNPSYRYGNQSEYTGHDDYGNYAYIPGDYTANNQNTENNTGYVQDPLGLAEESSQPSNPSSSTSSLNGATVGGNRYLPDLHPASEQNFHNPAYDLTPQSDSLVPDQGVHLPGSIPAIRVCSPCGTLTMDSLGDLTQEGGKDSVNHASPTYSLHDTSNSPHNVDEHAGSHMPLLTNDNKSTPFVQTCRHKMEETDAPECDDDERTLLLATFDDLEPTFV